LLERALFQRGYEVLLATAAEVHSLEQFLALARGTQAAGLILIYSTAALDLPTEQALTTLAADAFFNLSAERLPSDDHVALETILPQFETLRIRSASVHPDQVN
jgi:hypothetical protein